MVVDRRPERPLLPTLGPPVPIAGAPAGPAQAHYLGLADADTTSQALIDWVRSAGLTPERLLPIDTAAIAATIERAAQAMTEPGVTVILYAGEHSSILA